jgi:CHAD domain-containing protein
VLASALQQVLANAREIALARHDDEHVHQLRVGLRRLRTALQELGKLGELEALAREVVPALQDVFHAAGEHRDRSTLVPALECAARAAGGPPLAWQPPLPDLAAAVRAWPFQDALLRVLASMQALAGQPDDGGRRKARKAVAARLDRLHRRVLRRGGDFRSLAPDERHAVRKRLKRLRYLAELTQPLFAAREVDAYVAQLKDLQDALGAYQDAVAGQGLFTAHAMEEPDAWFAAGWLAGREPMLVAACERARRKAARKARPFWD